MLTEIKPNETTEEDGHLSWKILQSFEDYYTSFDFYDVQ